MAKRPAAAKQQKLMAQLQWEPCQGPFWAHGQPAKFPLPEMNCYGAYICQGYNNDLQLDGKPGARMRSFSKPKGHQDLCIWSSAQGCNFLL